LLSGQGRDGGIGIGSARDVTLFQGAPQLVARSSYLEQVRRIAPPDPPGLRDRDAELAELARFCMDPDGASYAWWRAGPWAGKSALLSTFVLRPPAEVRERVVVVSFFITARLAAQDTREAFTEVLLEQLAALLSQSLPSALPEAIREAHLLGLLSQAAAACAGAGRRLVLVVDGLDEDRGVTAGLYPHSIAGLLPADPPAGMRVIVAGRPNPPVPDDVPDWHPLRNPAIARPLAASPHARDLQRLGRHELQRLLRGSQAEQDVLGLLTAAHGGLSAQDLAELTSTSLWEVEEILHTVAGRTLQVRPSLLDPEGRPDVYLLGHEGLLAPATEYLGDRLNSYRERLRSWAGRWRARGWPAETPEYLLGPLSAKIVMLGEGGSGKTTFLGALNIALTRRDYGFLLTGRNNVSVEQMIDMTETLTMTREFPKATRTIDHFEWQLFRDPFSAPALGGRNRIDLSLVDPSGDLMRPERRNDPHRKKLIDDLVDSDGILFMFDPIKGFEIGDAFGTTGGMLRLLSDVIAHEKRNGPDKTLPQHVAVCITKFDEIKMLEIARHLGIVRRNVDDPFQLPRVSERDALRLFSALTSKDGGMLLSALQQAFPGRSGSSSPRPSGPMSMRRRESSTRTTRRT
jgi:energy-coupling factor transporter ATP-binding protein EcfA2